VRTLVEMLQRMPALGQRDAIRWRAGYRTLRMPYAELYSRIGGCARYLDQRGLKLGDRLILWGVNAPEWVVVFWACVARGIQVVPLDSRSSPALVRRVQEQVRAKFLVCDAHVDAATVASAGDDAAGITRFEEIAALAPSSRLSLEPVTSDDVVEIVFTSGTTGDPKGVVHRHRNICANLTPIAREIERYRIPLRVVGALRLLDMLPLSHLFGQSLGLYVPVLLGGTSVFTDELGPGAVLETIRRERVTAAAVVPKMLESLQHETERRHGLERAQMVAESGEASSEPRGSMAARIWQHRSLHRVLGWRFWFFVVGGAAVRRELERFWAQRGFIVVQGYGLTETSPVVAVNHPLRARRGSIGRPLSGLEVRIAPDGEILVRGDSVVSEYWTSRGTEPVAGEEGWLHTGDLGELDSEGRLYYRGRKKDVIVVADGMNVHPQDVEAVLNSNPAVRDSAVVGVGSPAAQRVHAALILNDPTVDLDELVRRANVQLESHQRIRSWSVWPQPDFPRTLSTAKVKRGEVAGAVEATAGHASGRPSQPSSGAVMPADASGAPGATSLYSTIAAVAQRDVGEIGPELSLEDDLGLSSLERVELLSALEHLFGVDLDETRLVEIDTVARLQEWIDDETGGAAGVRIHAVSAEQAPAGAGAAAASRAAAPARREAVTSRPQERRSVPLPRWRSRWPVRLVRRAFQDAVVVPLLRGYCDLHIEGRRHLECLEAPVLLAANHTSHLDTPAVLAALPIRWRRRVAPAMMSEYFRGYLQPDGAPRAERWLRALQFHLASGLLNAFPLPQRMGGIRRVLQYMGEQVDAGACPLVFPEGGRSRDGTLQAFKPGIGLMAVSMQIPVVPLHLRGVFEALPPGQRWPRRARVRVRVGEALRFAPDVDHRAAARDVEQAIRALSVQ
jgi:long-chain acyl-CoA synthetase